MSGCPIIHGVIGHPWGILDGMGCPARSGRLMWDRSPHTNRRGGAPGLATMEGSMTDRRKERDDERRKRRKTEEDDERRREDKEKRSDELKESWRRNHPSGQEEERKDRPKRGHQA